MNASSTPQVAIVLLNYRGVEKTLACLASLQALTYPAVKIFVVDNASGDGSAEALQSTGLNIQLIVSDHNRGYSGGNNLAIRQAMVEELDYVWLLNNDTTVDPNALTALIAQAQKSGGLVGSLLKYPDGRYQQSGTQLNLWTGRARGTPETQVWDGMTVDSLTGASMLVPMRVFRQVGLLDERYFLYCEDAEFCLRAQKQGFPITVATGSVVYHEEGASTGKQPRHTQYYFHRNRLKLVLQHGNRFQRATAFLYTGLRLLRAGRKATTAEGLTRLRIQWRATCDAWQGVDGPCPHRLEAL